VTITPHRPPEDYTVVYISAVGVRVGELGRHGADLMSRPYGGTMSLFQKDDKRKKLSVLLLLVKSQSPAELLDNIAPRHPQRPPKDRRTARITILQLYTPSNRRRHDPGPVQPAAAQGHVFGCLRWYKVGESWFSQFYGP